MATAVEAAAVQHGKGGCVMRPAPFGDENTILTAPAVERMDNATAEGRYHLEDIDGDDDDEEDNNANEEVVEDGGIILEDMNRFITFYRWMRIWEQQCCCCQRRIEDMMIIR